MATYFLSIFDLSNNCNKKKSKILKIILICLIDRCKSSFSSNTKRLIKSINLRNDILLNKIFSALKKCIFINLSET